MFRLAIRRRTIPTLSALRRPCQAPLRHFPQANIYRMASTASNPGENPPGPTAAELPATSSTPPPPPTTTTLKSTHPMVWIDCEMTGLNPPHDKLLQIACFITDHNLTLLDSVGFETVISRPQSLLDGMDDWCKSTHGSTGLTRRVLDPAVAISIEEAGRQLLAYIKRYVPLERTGILCGNSVHFDKVFLREEVPEVVEWLHYRVGDVSSIKEFAKRWCSEETLKAQPVKGYVHEAKQDILESIEEARYWRRVLFEGK